MIAHLIIEESRARLALEKPIEEAVVILYQEYLFFTEINHCYKLTFPNKKVFQRQELKAFK